MGDLIREVEPQEQPSLKHVIDETLPRVVDAQNAVARRQPEVGVEPVSDESEDLPVEIGVARADVGGEANPPLLIDRVAGARVALELTICEAWRHGSSGEARFDTRPV